MAASAVTMASGISGLPPQHDQANLRKLPKPGMFSRLTLLWIGPLVRSGFKKVLTADDLWPVFPSEDPTTVANEFMKKYFEKEKGERSMAWTTFSLVRWNVFWSVILFTLFSALRFMGPFLLQLIVQFVQEDPPVTPLSTGALYAAGLFVSQVLGTLCQTKANYLMFVAGLRVKNALVGATFRHAAHLNNAGKQQTTNGQVINLVATDSQMVVEFMRFINQFWSAPIILIAGVIYIYSLIGYAVLAGVSIMILFVPISIRLGKIQTKIQGDKMKFTDRRVKLTNEALQGIKVLKLYAWEDAVHQRLDEVRAAEIGALRRVMVYGAITLPIAITVPNLASVITFIVVVLNDGDLDPQLAFAVVSLFVIIRSPFVTFPLAITMVSRILVAFRRLGDFFDLPTRPPREVYPKAETDEYAVCVQNGRFAWDDTDLCEPELSKEGEENGGADGVRVGAAGVSIPNNAVTAAPTDMESMSMMNAEAKQQRGGAAVGDDDNDAIAAADAHVVAIQQQQQQQQHTKSVSSSTASENDSIVLSNVNLNIASGELVAVCGIVGSGKSSLCSALLGEMTRVSGSVRVAGSVAYCAQEAFILNATVRENITFGKAFDQELYDRVVYVCALSSDLVLLPAGDMTEIGEKGINLSGGQKARISLARAVYSDADVFVLDDPLSAVDAHVGRYIFEKCISNHPDSALAGKTRVLVTNNLHVLESTLTDAQQPVSNTPENDDRTGIYPVVRGGVDRIITLDKGTVSQVGTFEELIGQKDGVLATLMAQMGSVAEQEKVEEGYVTVTLDGGAVDVATDNLAVRLGDDVVVAEVVQNGDAEDGVNTENVALNAENVAIDAENVAMNGKKSVVINDGKSVEEIEVEKPEEERKQRLKGRLTSVEHQNKGKIKWKVYASYFLAGTYNSWFGAAVLVSLFALTEAAFLSVDSWLAVWSSTDDKDPMTFVYVYVGLTVTFFTIMMVRSLSFALFAVRSAHVLSSRLTHHVLRLPLPFFWATPTGRLMNRFSRDQNDIDQLLPQSWQWFLMTLSRVLGIVGLIIVTVPIFAAFLVPMMLIYVLVREYYRRSARELQRIESVQRSPVFNHLTETLSGTSTIRAYDRVDPWIQVADDHQGRNHRAKFALEAIQIWLAQRLEFLGALVVFVSAMSIVGNRTTTDPGLAGLAIAYSLNIVINLNMSVRTSTQVEAQITAVERILEYTEEPIEADTFGPSEFGQAAKASMLADAQRDLKSKSKSKSSCFCCGKGNARTSDNVISTQDIGAENNGVQEWPNQGVLEFKDVYFRYKTSLEPALKALCFKIEAGEFVGLVGRTGAGKSSIMVAIFRLVDVFGGQILIDGVDLKSLSRHKIRSSITLIPQDPVLFLGTIRYNLDPFSSYTDDELWTALRRAHLSDMVSALPEKLEAPVSENGDNISMGERALVCLARALLRRSRLVLLDEATAAVDASTDALVQNTIRTEFEHATCLVIAHRLNTVIDSDKVLVLGEGQVLEYDKPDVLLANPESTFSKLVAETGAVNAAKLVDAARRKGLRSG